MTAVGIALALAIGAACRQWAIPLPAPPTFTGALLIVATTSGFLLADAWLR